MSAGRWQRELERVQAENAELLDGTHPELHDMLYIEIGGEPMPAADVHQWAEWMLEGDMENPPRRMVAWDQIADDEDSYVSTLFLGNDVNHLGIGRPLLYESMVVGGPMDGTQWRYETRKDAGGGHRALLQQARQAE